MRIYTHNKLDRVKKLFHLQLCHLMIMRRSTVAGDHMQ